MKLNRILLVEDSSRDVELTMMALQNSRLANAIVVARDGEEALQYLRHEGLNTRKDWAMPVAVLLDLKLPKVNGLEVLATIRGDEKLKHLPVVVLTSSREEPDLKRAYEMGVNAYIVKPVNLEQMVQVVRQTGLFWAMINEPPPGIQRLSH